MVEVTQTLAFSTTPTFDPFTLPSLTTVGRSIDLTVYQSSNKRRRNWRNVETSWRRCVPSGRESLMLASLGNDGSVLMYGGLNIINNTYNIFNEAWVSTGSTEICCQPKSSDYKAQCATFIDATSCDDYSKGFGDFCAWKC